VPLPLSPPFFQVEQILSVSFPSECLSIPQFLPASLLFLPSLWTPKERTFYSLDVVRWSSPFVACPLPHPFIGLRCAPRWSISSRVAHPFGIPSMTSGSERHVCSFFQSPSPFSPLAIFPSGTYVTRHNGRSPSLGFHLFSSPLPLV